MQSSKPTSEPSTLILLCALIVLLGRLWITPRLTTVPSAEGIYEATAHLFVGFLIAAPFYDKKQQLGPSHLYGVLGWALTAWEALWFFVQKYFN